MGIWMLLLLLITEYTCENDNIAQVGLQVHNKFRSRHNVPHLILDEQLMAQAQKCAVHYASSRKLDHKCRRANTGENLFSLSGSANPDFEKISKDAIQAWYAEIRNYDFKKPFQKKGVVGHFTQLVWKSSKKLGFGVATNKSYSVVVAQYSPQGNVVLSGGGSDTLYKLNVLPSSQSSILIQSTPNLLLLTPILIICSY